MSIKLHLKGKQSLVDYFREMTWSGKYLQEQIHNGEDLRKNMWASRVLRDGGIGFKSEWESNISEITVKTDCGSLTFSIADDDEVPDGTILIYDPLDQESWDMILKEYPNSLGQVVIAGWYKTKSRVESTGDVNFETVSCSFTEKYKFDCPHFEMIWCEDLWDSLQVIVEKKLDKYFNVNLSELMAPAYHGEELQA
jgi:hypothetical protein